eukprot:CAMPEP_0113296190 /NCGR_PEP_ID=MMETSP0008_2-20120614/36866_1 /TAXON_ID=97485 /ORGANISM="Prymnesium parvum" /LENGTH=52 /DNA_ID=CAMNT_0000148985 /DNA_START=435 /DNA_END=589 /DNA_ORIENTATION=+ /assembly_acc=CAM_ASM_000153
MSLKIIPEAGISPIVLSCSKVSAAAVLSTSAVSMAADDDPVPSPKHKLLAAA